MKYDKNNDFSKTILLGITNKTIKEILNYEKKLHKNI